MAYRNLKMIMPSVDDFVMQVLGMSEAQYDGAWIIGWSQFNNRRPAGWPTSFTILAYYGFMPDSDGWRTFVQMHIGVDVASISVHRQEQGAERENRRWRIANNPEYTGTYSEDHAALLTGGLTICDATFRRTGRMMLR